jgi:phosphate transport system substrate-binding protein
VYCKNKPFLVPCKNFMTIDKKIRAILCCIVLMMPQVFWCQEKITIKGSDTMVLLVQRWTELFPHEHASLQFQVTGGGSGTGISSLINGTTDICASSRPMKQVELQMLFDRNKQSPSEVRVARDGIAIYVHKDSPVNRLTVKQVRKIFSGQITNWREIGGPNKRIVIYSRENNSGTYEFFKEHILLNLDFTPITQHLVGTSALINAISKDPFGIGFGGIAYASGAKQVAVAVDESSQYVLPTQETVVYGAYPISRLLYFYTSQRPSGKVKEFIDWIISPYGQNVVEAVGYLPLYVSNQTISQPK